MMLKTFVVMALAGAASGQNPCTTAAPPTQGPVFCDSFDCASPCAIGGPWDPKPDPATIACPERVCDKKLCCIEPTTTTVTTTTTLLTCEGFDCKSPCAIGGPWDDKDGKDSIQCGAECDKKKCCDPPTTTTVTTTTVTTTTTLETCCEFDCKAPCAIGGPWDEKKDMCDLKCQDNDPSFLCDKKYCCKEPTTTTTTTTTVTTTTTLETCCEFDCQAPCAIGGPWDDKKDMCDLKCKDNEPSFECDKKYCCVAPTTTTTTTTTVTTTTTLETCCEFECQAPCAIGGPWYDKDNMCDLKCKDNEPSFECDKKYCCDPPTTTTTTTTTVTTTTTIETCKSFDCKAPCAIGGPWDDKDGKDGIECEGACDKKQCCLEPTTTTVTTTTLKTCEAFSCTKDDWTLAANAAQLTCPSNDCDDAICCQPPNPCATVGTPAPVGEPSPCTTVGPIPVSRQRLYSEEQKQQAAAKPQQAQSWALLPAVGMFAMCALLGGYAVSLYRRRSRRTTTARSVFGNLAQPLEVEDSDAVELGDASSEELLLE